MKRKHLEFLASVMIAVFETTTFLLLGIGVISLTSGSGFNFLVFFNPWTWFLLLTSIAKGLAEIYFYYNTYQNSRKLLEKRCNC